MDADIAANARYGLDPLMRPVFDAMMALLAAQDRDKVSIEITLFGATISFADGTPPIVIDSRTERARADQGHSLL